MIDFDEATPDQRKEFAESFVAALQNIQEAFHGHITDVSLNDNGVYIQTQWTTYGRCGDVDEHSVEYTIPAEVFGNHMLMLEWKKQEDARRDAAAKKIKDDAEARAVKVAAAAREKREREEYVRLQQKFGA